MHEYFCSFVDRDLTKCSSHLRIDDRNSYQVLQAIEQHGWAVGFGDARCSVHKPQDGDKVKKK